MTICCLCEGAHHATNCPRLDPATILALGEQNRGKPLQPCGTVAAMLRHRRNGETPCEACRGAERRYRARRRVLRAVS